MWKIISLIGILTTVVDCQTRRCDIWNYKIEVSYSFPLLETENGLVYIHEEYGTIRIEHDESIQISCVGNYLEYNSVGYEDKETANLTCRDGATFSDDWIPGSEVELRWVSCAKPANTIEKHTQKRCGEDDKGHIVEMYVESKLHDDHFLYEICFDNTIKQPLYAKYTLDSRNKRNYRHHGIKFFAGSSEAYSGVHLNKIYDYGSQRDVVWAILGSNTWEYHNYENQLVNSSLNDRLNYNFDPIQRATFNYINAVPLWNKITSGSWLSSSSGVRDLIEDNELTVYSGAWGVHTLKDENGDQQEIWLEGKGSKRYPSPLWLYRAVYEETTKKGIVFLILNNPFIKLAEAEQLAQIFPCIDVCPNMSWITSATPAKGYVKCCAIDDFRKVIKDLPDFETESLLP